MTFEVLGAPTLELSFSANGPSCGESNGKLSVSVSGGTPPYTYLWTNYETTPTITGLTAGPYAVTVVDAAGCEYKDKYILDDCDVQPTNIDLELDTEVNPGSTTEGGSATIVVTVSNTSSNPASGVVVNSQIPGCAVYSGDNSGGSYDPATGNWTIGSIPAGGTVQLVITVQANCNFTSCAEVASANETDVDSTPGNGINGEDDSDCDDIIVEEDDTCLPPFGPGTMDEGCIDPVTPTQVCIPVTDPQGGNVTIVDVEHTFNCSIELDGGTCFTFTALPGFEGEAVVTVTYCNECSPALCATTVVTFDVNCEEEIGNRPPVGPDKIDLGTIPPVTPTEVCLDL